MLILESFVKHNNWFAQGPRGRASGVPAPWERSDEGKAGFASKERSDAPLGVLIPFNLESFPP